MIRVLFLINHAGKAGTERYVYAMMEALHEKKIQAYFAYNEEGLLLEQVKTLGIVPFRLEMKKPWDIRAAIKLNQYCTIHQIEIVHTQFMRENGIAMLGKILGGKYQVFYTNHLIMEKSFLMKLFHHATSPFLHRAIAVCHAGKAMMMVNGMKEEKIRVIHNGVDVELWNDQAPSTLRDELNIPAGTLVLHCASRFAEGKGHAFLLKAIRALKERTQKQFVCILANDGPLLEKQKKWVQDQQLDDVVRFLGFRTDMQNLIRSSDISISPSQQEALSFAILEVLSCGVPVIATRVGGTVDIFPQKNPVGELVAYDDWQALSEALYDLIENKRKREQYGNNARRHIVLNFSLDKMVEETYNEYVKANTKG